MVFLFYEVLRIFSQTMTGWIAGRNYLDQKQLVENSTLWWNSAADVPVLTNYKI